MDKSVSAKYGLHEILGSRNTYYRCPLKTIPSSAMLNPCLCTWRVLSFIIKSELLFYWRLPWLIWLCHFLLFCVPSISIQAIRCNLYVVCSSNQTLKSRVQNEQNTRPTLVRWFAKKKSTITQEMGNDTRYNHELRKKVEPGRNMIVQQILTQWWL